MQATLIYNQSAGSINQTTVEDLQQALQEAGYKPVYRATSSEQDLDPILNEELEGIVVVAGGDGTTRAVATRLIGKGVPLAILPMGSANNMARTLELQQGPMEIIKGLREPRKTYLDVGYVRGPWGEDYFMEGVGFGFFADTLARYDPEKGKSILRSLDSALETLGEYRSYTIQMTLDGRDLSGRYLMVEVLNTTAVGPRLKLAPQASPEDGVFDVVCFHDNEQEGIMSYLTGMLLEELDQLESVEVKRGRRLEVQWTGFPVHIDGEIRPQPQPRPEDRNPARGARPDYLGATEALLMIELVPQALEVWVPQPQAQEG